MLVTGIGRSTDIDGDVAVAEAIGRAEQALEGRAPSGGLLLVGSEYDRAGAARAVAARWPGLPFIGCTTCGDLTGAEGPADDAVTLVLFASERVRFSAGWGEGLSRDPARAVDEALARAGVRAEAPPALVLTTPDGLRCDVLGLLERLQRGTGGAPIVGGTSATQRLDERVIGATTQICGGRALTDAVPVLAIEGPLRAAWGIGCGWIPMGPTHRVTAADGHRVRTIDGRPAIETFRAYLGQQDPGFFGEFPLAVYGSEGSGEGGGEGGAGRPDDEAYLMRAVFGTEPDGTLVLAAAVPEGARVRVATADVPEVIGGARGAMREAILRYREAYGPEARPDAALLFTCAGRRWVLGSRVGEEHAAVVEVMRRFDVDPTRLAGFFANGEIAPLRRGGPSTLHNTSCVALLLGEGA